MRKKKGKSVDKVEGKRKTLSRRRVWFLNVDKHGSKLACLPRVAFCGETSPFGACRVVRPCPHSRFVSFFFFLFLKSYISLFIYLFYLFNNSLSNLSIPPYPWKRQRLLTRHQLCVSRIPHLSLPSSSLLSFGMVLGEFDISFHLFVCRAIFYNNFVFNLFILRKFIWFSILNLYF